MSSYKSRLLGRLRLKAYADRGATAVEYGLMVGLVGLVVFAGVTSFGTAVRVKLFEMIVSSLTFF